MKYHIHYVLIVFLLVGCTGKTANTIVVTDETSNVIDLTNGLKNIQTVRLSEIADSVTFIPFETMPQSLQGQGQKNIIFSIPYIFYYDKYFDWTGKYCGTIVKKGQGPYEEPEGGLLLYKDNRFYSKGSKFIEYDVTGKPTGKIRYLYAGYDDDNGILKNVSAFFSTGDYFAVYNYPLDVYFFNKDFETVSSRRILEVDSVKPLYNNIGDSKAVTSYKDHILFYNFMNDTVFYVTDTDLEPKWVVSFDDPARLSTEVILNTWELFGKVAYALRGGSQALEHTELVQLTDNKHKVIAVYETEKHLIFQMTEIIQFAEPRGKQPTKPYIVYYDKHTGKTVRVKGNGFEDDLLGMDYLYPLLGVFDEKLITYIWPYELLNYIDECREKGRKVNPKLLALSKQVKEDDNPVLILAHFR